MFLPLLTASKVSNGKKMIGMIVEVWTGDDQRFLYVITDVFATRRSTTSSTSRSRQRPRRSGSRHRKASGPSRSCIVKAEPLSQEAAPHAEAHPKAKPLNCS